ASEALTQLGHVTPAAHGRGRGREGWLDHRSCCADCLGLDAVEADVVAGRRDDGVDARRSDIDAARGSGSRLDEAVVLEQQQRFAGAASAEAHLVDQLVLAPEAMPCRKLFVEDPFPELLGGY